MKRCRSTAPAHTELRCELERGHRKANPMSLHQSGDVVWGSDDRHFHKPGTRKTLSEMLQGRGLIVDFNTTPLMDQIRNSAWSGASMGIHSDHNMDMPAPESAEDRFGESMAAPADPEQQLIDWWMGKAATEAEATVPKAIEYGATDLVDIGMMLARTMRREVNEEEAAELGVFFYLIGKIARWQSAIERGDRPSDDTLLDIGVYVRMAQRIRHAGNWPGVNFKEGK